MNQERKKHVKGSGEAGGREQAMSVDRSADSQGAFPKI